MTQANPTIDKLSELYTFAEVERRKAAFFGAALSQALQFITATDPDAIKNVAESLGNDITILQQPPAPEPVSEVPIHNIMDSSAPADAESEKTAKST